MLRNKLPMIFAGVFVFATLAIAQNPAKPLTNEDVIAMMSGGLPEGVIIGAIAANDVNFDVSVNGLLALKKAGVGDKVVEAMLAAEAKKRNPAAVPQNTTPPQAHPALPPQAMMPNNMLMPGGVNPAQMSAQILSMFPPQMLAMMPAATRQQMMSQMAQSRVGMMGTPLMANAAGMPEIGQLVKVVLLLPENKQVMQASVTQIAEATTKGGAGGGTGMASGMGAASSMASMAMHGGMGGMGMGGLGSLSMLGGMGGTALKFAPLAAGPGMMFAGPAMSLATGLLSGGLTPHSSLPTTTYVWALPGHNSSFQMPTATPRFEIEFGDIVGVDPDSYEPAIVKLAQTKDNWRLVGATKDKLDKKGNETRSAITEDRSVVKTTTLGRGHVVLESAAPLPPGEYGVVLHPLKPQKKPAGMNTGLTADETIFYSVWDFSVKEAEPVATPPAPK
jgi:hypothetical protein